MAVFFFSPLLTAVVTVLLSPVADSQAGSRPRPPRIKRRGRKKEETSWREEKEVEKKTKEFSHESLFTTKNDSGPLKFHEGLPASVGGQQPPPCGLHLILPLNLPLQT